METNNNNFDEGKSVLTRSPIITNIALGQGGYNSMRAMLDYPSCSPENCFAINYEADLKSAHLIDDKNKITLPGYGAGHDRAKAQTDLLRDVKQLIQEDLAKKINPKTDKIYIHVAGGGGCGSGIAAIVAGLVSNDGFIAGRVGRRLPVEVILYKPADTTDASNVGEWQNFNECLKEFDTLVQKQAIAVYIADLSTSPNDNPVERNTEVNREVAALLYRFDCLNFLSNYSNLDFEDRYKLSVTPGVRGILKFNPVDKSYSSPFVLPNGGHCRRIGYEIQENTEQVMLSITKTLGVEALDKSFGGLYPEKSVSIGAFPFVIYSGYEVPISLKAKAQSTVSELEKKRQNLIKAEQSQGKDAYDKLKANRQAMDEANSMNNMDINDLLACFDND